MLRVAALAGERSPCQQVVELCHAHAWLSATVCRQFETVVMIDVQNWKSDELRLAAALFRTHPNAVALFTEDKVVFSF